MANRKLDKLAKKIRKSGPNESGLCKRNGIHTAAAQLMGNLRISRTKAYKKLLDQYDLSKEEIITLAHSLRVDISELVPT